MDPITRASDHFLAEADTFWRSGQGPILPMVAGPSERGHLVKALRLAELGPENRRPLFLHEEPFSDPRAYFEGLAAAIQRDYERIRLAAMDEGVSLAPLRDREGARREAEGPEAAAVRVIEQAAALLGDRLEGVLVALVPAQVVHVAPWRASLSALTRMKFSARVRVAVLDSPGEPLKGVLGEAGARFTVDAAELIAFLDQLGSGASRGPEQTAPSLSDEKRRAFEIATGRALPTPDTAVKLHALLRDAAREISARGYTAAATLYGQARELCRASGLVLEEAMVLMALGGAALAAGEPEIAIDGYQNAAMLAQASKAWPLTSQAWLGVGGVYLNAKRPHPAAVAYRRAAESAQRGAIPFLQIEALRMAGTCLLMKGQRADAVTAWIEALAIGAAQGAPAREASTLRQVTDALTQLLLRLGLTEQAAHVQALADAEAR